MQLHGNARTTPYIRREMVRRVRERAEPVTETAAALGVSARTVYKWLDRYEREGEAGNSGVSGPASRRSTSAAQTLYSAVPVIASPSSTVSRLARASPQCSGIQTLAALDLPRQNGSGTDLAAARAHPNEIVGANTSLGRIRCTKLDVALRLLGGQSLGAPRLGGGVVVVQRASGRQAQRIDTIGLLDRWAILDRLEQTLSPQNTFLMQESRCAPASACPTGRPAWDKAA